MVRQVPQGQKEGGACRDSVAAQLEVTRGHPHHGPHHWVAPEGLPAQDDAADAAALGGTDSSKLAEVHPPGAAQLSDVANDCKQHLAGY